jgi:hypothetical protein
MYTKQDFINSTLHEMNVIKHLAEKIPADTLGYKPTEGQRTTLELLQYLSIVAAAGSEMVLKNDHTVFAPYTDIAKETTLENFAAAMDATEAKFKQLMDETTDEALAKPMSMFGGPEKSTAAYLVDGPGKWLTAYKMQLFLYIKASGNSSLGTSNVWGGFDAPVQ